MIFLPGDLAVVKANTRLGYGYYNRCVKILESLPYQGKERLFIQECYNVHDDYPETLLAHELLRVDSGLVLLKHGQILHKQHYCVDETISAFQTLADRYGVGSLAGSIRYDPVNHPPFFMDKPK